MLDAFAARVPACRSRRVDDRNERPRPGHPAADARAAWRRRAGRSTWHAPPTRDGLLVVLLSGGASAMMALPAEGVTLEDKQQTVRRLLMRGADIHELNTVRKHLSAIKGGQLAAASRRAS